MRSTYLLILSLLGLVFVSNAQHQHSPKCYSSEYLQKQLKEDPTFKQNIENLNIFAQYFTENAEKSNTIVTIPVVFHVVYNTNAENISEQRLMEQLDVLNQDFRKLNSDTNKVPNAFKSVFADSEIQFCLAVKDPNGNATTGITRTQTTITTFTFDDDVKFNSLGGKTIWDRNKYLNIWVCNLGTQLLGYAQFPGGGAQTDGVVLNYRFTGKTGATSPYNLGRTATHEVGHWLGLYHIWGDDQDDADKCAGSDLVSDTPNQEVETIGSKTAGVVITDACSPNSPGIMWMNYMDYTNDNSLYMFTNGQKTRMRSAITNSRSGLNNSSLTNCALGFPYTNTFTTSPTTDGWEIQNLNTGTNTWTRVTNAGFTDNSSMQMDNFSGSDITGQLDHLITKEFNFFGHNNTMLSFYRAYARYDNTSNDSLLVYYTTNNGTNWNLIYNNGGSGLATASNTTSAFVPTSGQWLKDSISLSVLDGESAVKFRFTSKSGWGNNLYLDDVEINANRIAGNSKQVTKLFEEVKIYPNPAANKLTIESNANRITKINIVNNVGQVVFQDSLNSYQTEIDINNLPTGLYLVNIETIDGNITKKISVIK
jgi:hypothetical protein